MLSENHCPGHLGSNPSPMSDQWIFWTMIFRKIIVPCPLVLSRLVYDVEHITIHIVPEMSTSVWLSCQCLGVGVRGTGGVGGRVGYWLRSRNGLWICQAFKCEAIGIQAPYVFEGQWWSEIKWWLEHWLDLDKAHRSGKMAPSQKQQQPWQPRILSETDLSPLSIFEQTNSIYF